MKTKIHNNNYDKQRIIHRFIIFVQTKQQYEILKSVTENTIRPTGLK